MPGRTKRMRYARADEPHRPGRAGHQQPVYTWRKAWVAPAKGADSDGGAASPYRVYKWVKSGQTVIHEDDDDDDTPPANPATAAALDGQTAPAAESTAAEQPATVNLPESTEEAVKAAAAAVEAVVAAANYKATAPETPSIGGLSTAQSKANSPGPTTAADSSVSDQSPAAMDIDSEEPTGPPAADATPAEATPADAQTTEELNDPRLPSPPASDGGPSL